MVWKFTATDSLAVGAYRFTACSRLNVPGQGLLKFNIEGASSLFFEGQLKRPRPR
jgi:hypothetical protein